MRSLFRGIVVAAALLCLLLPGRQAQACKCIDTSPEKQLAMAEHVALVDILAVQPLGDGSGEESARFDVARSFKGRMNALVDLRGFDAGSNCRVALRAGKRYLIALIPGSNLVTACYGILGPLHHPPVAQGSDPATAALEAFLDSLAAHLWLGTPLAMPAEDVLEKTALSGAPLPEG